MWHWGTALALGTGYRRQGIGTQCGTGDTAPGTGHGTAAGHGDGDRALAPCTALGTGLCHWAQDSVTGHSTADRALGTQYVTGDVAPGMELGQGMALGTGHPHPVRHWAQDSVTGHSTADRALGTQYGTEDTALGMGHGSGTGHGTRYRALAPSMVLGTGLWHWEQGTGDRSLAPSMALGTQHRARGMALGQGMAAGTSTQYGTGDYAPALGIPLGKGLWHWVRHWGQGSCTGDHTLGPGH